MLKVEMIDVWGFKHAIRGMRNPLNSWDKSDSIEYRSEEHSDINIGKNDLELMSSLYIGGTEHRKYLRQICVSMDITAPLYWWKEFDTYKIGTTSNSCSTMHKIHSKEFTLDDFSTEHLLDFTSNIVNTIIEVPTGNHMPPINGEIMTPMSVLKITIQMLNNCRDLYNKTHDKDYWWQLIQLLPTSYNQKRTIIMNYENVMNIINQRDNHKLDEWRELVRILRTLPYVTYIRGECRDTWNETT